MLYDPKWEQKTKADPSFDGFIRWLEQQPADGCYDYRNPGCCCLQRYGKSIGHGTLSAFDALHITVLGPDGEHNHVVKSRPWTYGAALARARKLRDAS